MGWRCWVWRSWPSGFTGSDEPAGANWGRGFRELRRPARLGVPDLATPGIQRPRPGRPKPAPGCTPAPEAGPPTPPAAGATGAGRTSPGPAWPKPAPGSTPAPVAGPPTPPAAGATGAGRTSPGPAWPKPAPGSTPAPVAGPPTPARIGWPWAGAIPPMPAPLRAMATNRGAEIRDGKDRCMAGAEDDNSIVGAELRLGISGRRRTAAQASSSVVDQLRL